MFNHFDWGCNFYNKKDYYPNLSKINRTGYIYPDEILFPNDDEIAYSCYNLGIMYSKGIGQIIDKDKAFKYFKKSCESGLQDGCDKANSMNF